MMKSKRPISTLYLIVLFVLACTAICACSGEQKPQTRPKLSIEVVHSAELRPALSALRERFNAANHTLIDGREIVLELRSEGALAAATGFASGEIKSIAWIAPGDALVEYANSKTHNLGAALTGCTTLFSTPVVYVLGPGSGLANSPATPQIDQLLDISFSHGTPRDSSSIMAVLQQLIVTAPKRAARDSIEVLREREQQAYRYDSSESALLEDLAAATTPDKRIVVTTEQVAANFNRGRKSALPLYYPQQGSTSLDYRLCTSSGDWVTAAHKAAIDELRSFFQLADAQTPFAELGFRTSVTTSSQESAAAVPKIEHVLAPMQAQDAVKILDNWREIRRPSAIAFVFDTSGSTDNGLLDELRSALRLSLARSASRDLRALVTFGSDAVVAAKLTSDPAKIIPVIDTLRSAGGAALYDAIKLASSEIDDASSGGLRRSIFVVTDSEDKNSSGSVEALKGLLQSQISSSQAQLLILAIPSQGENVDKLNAFVKDVGGTIKVVQLAQTRAAFDELVASIE